MRNKQDLLNSWGEDFWKRHFGVFNFLRWCFFKSIDMLDDKFRNPELTMILAGIFLININLNVLGSVSLGELCYEYQEELVSQMPAALSLRNPFSMYVNWFYILYFVGNLKSSPFALTVICASAHAYDTIIKLIDTSFCPTRSTESDRWYSQIFIWAVYRSFMNCWALFYWLAIVMLPKRLSKKFQLSELINLNNSACKILFCKRAKKTKEILTTPFKIPFRIRASAFFSIFATIVDACGYTLFSYSIIYLTDDLRSYRDYLTTQPGNDIFIALFLKETHIVTVSEGIDFLGLVIKCLEPIFPCIVVSIAIGSILTLYSIGLMLFRYKQYMLIIVNEPENRDFLKRVWRFPSYLAIFFPSQFVTNTLFLHMTFSIVLCSFIYAFTLFFMIIDISSYFMNKPLEFWLALVFLFWGLLYFPHLVEKDGTVKNKKYFCLWDSWFLFAGFTSSALIGFFRYFFGAGIALFLGFRAHISNMAPPFDRLDALYRSFYGSITLYCIILGIMPTNDELLEIANAARDKGPAKIIF
ncbi:unnamed protein product [Blepharisma stoltei]|uniref:Odorant receptor n=1 Tax=Blepharisma stoltei TaxID=1481888 RepID=A0AAU9JMU2_9CILI|nr:unnamed protein product [Blepharisma stoltei]